MKDGLICIFFFWFKICIGTSLVLSGNILGLILGVVVLLWSLLWCVDDESTMVPFFTIIPLILSGVAGLCYLFGVETRTICLGVGAVVVCFVGAIWGSGSE